jgi:nitrogen fixation/metabolism regulation signal transduction histidine kinase
MAEGDRRFGRRAVLAVLAVFAIPPVVLVALAVTDLTLASELVLAVVMVPLLAVTVALAVIAREVASSPDEPELIDEHMAERVGMTSEEYEELLEQ